MKYCKWKIVLYQTLIFLPFNEDNHSYFIGLLDNIPDEISLEDKTVLKDTDIKILLKNF